MIRIHDITNTIFSSKTYILYREGEDKAWLVDIGESGFSRLYVFVSHAHFDHIYGLEALVERFPDCKVYCTDYCKEALASEKLNLSKYHGTPIIYTWDNVVIVHEGETLRLFEGEPRMEFYETPGHNPGCLTMVLVDCVFTGDAYIPGIGASTHLPGADKELAKQSEERILELSAGRRILSGHDVG